MATAIIVIIIIMMPTRMLIVDAEVRMTIVCVVGALHCPATALQRLHCNPSPVTAGLRVVVAARAR